MLGYVCKYTPAAILNGFAAEYRRISPTAQDFSGADGFSHANLCSFAKSIIESGLHGEFDELVLTDCCDAMRRAYDVLRQYGKLKFIYLLSLPRCVNACSKELFAQELRKFTKAYADYSKKTFEWQLAAKTLSESTVAPVQSAPYISLLGARTSGNFSDFVNSLSDLPVQDDTCGGQAPVGLSAMPNSEDEFYTLYADVLLSGVSCMRMTDVASRRRFTENPHLRGIVYHTVKFCDYYPYEYAALLKSDFPTVRVETDLTLGSEGQLKTRLEAFFETLGEKKMCESTDTSGKYFAGVDSGSTSTNAVILNENRKIVGSAIVPTGARVAQSADRALAEAMRAAGIRQEDIARTVSTGYGRAGIGTGDRAVTEITCHAKGAHFLNPEVRTVIDIGGQDSKVIRLNADGSVRNFQMNDKCAAGTGRFLENMARVLEMTVADMGARQLSVRENLKISNMCTVFAESEVVSLIAENKRIDDILDALYAAVCSKVNSLLTRAGREGKYMMTGGVAQNRGLVQKLENTLGEPVQVYPEAQICGALGAALLASEQ